MGLGRFTMSFSGSLWFFYRIIINVFILLHNYIISSQKPLHPHLEQGRGMRQMVIVIVILARTQKRITNPSTHIYSEGGWWM